MLLSVFAACCTVFDHDFNLGTESWPPNGYFGSFSKFADALATFVYLVEGLALHAGWNDQSCSFQQ